VASQTLTIRKPDDWHVHLRDGEMMQRVAPYTARQFARAIVMPNLAPPVTTVEAARGYRKRILEATAPGFTRLVAADQPRILLQRLGETDGPVRAHPDLATADRSADTDRHVALGARVVGVHGYWTVLTAPGGQVYCLTDRSPMAPAQG
jgi:hypothetical protein